ncbi:hypothetical protein HXX76_007991 [Chlamydomonas incerta]|uniref:Extradiol ring-cleavage dioxygenase class III enzyme subunit B domain-containing protein n=1 Tax=Chlamydomonas incerta TaxID=51695 RepID=A0A835SYW7_CHLIN|nr:hypothetical protein HXX76_007991 [Chlamydomonas incerta]|eukprot:KAG2434266.1 hypothetical protein HXX76_007991 [Chlamydomonas incerta]
MTADLGQSSAVTTALLVEASAVSSEDSIVLCEVAHAKDAVAAVPQQFLLYNDPTAEGAVSFEEWNLTCSYPPCSYRARLDLDVRVTEKLTAALLAAGASVTSLSGFGPPGVAATGGAAADAAAGAARSAAPQLPRTVLLGMPSRRYERSVAMVPELLALGRHLFTYLDPLDLRVAVVVSGDLAHTWSADGPYGFSEHAAKFDAAVQDWARQLDRDALIKVAAKHVGEAKSCGFPGLVALQGVIDSVKPDNLHSILLEYGHPLYYGCMCALFDFQGDA